MSQCIVIVQFDGLTASKQDSIARSKPGLPIYRGLGEKGLLRKDYINGPTGAGGVYLWRDRASAEAWFTEDRIAELTKRLGVRPRLTWYETSITVDNIEDEVRIDGEPVAV